LNCYAGPRSLDYLSERTRRDYPYLCRNRLTEAHAWAFAVDEFDTRTLKDVSDGFDVFGFEIAMPGFEIPDASRREHGEASEAVQRQVYERTARAALGWDHLCVAARGMPPIT
jgi:hypothetical protein